MYLSLKDFDHLRDDQTVRFREEVVDGVPLTIVVYMIANDDLWNKDLGEECRGITFFSETGELASLPFEKFFNVNEKAHTQSHLIEKEEIKFILEKHDGSMITPALINGEVFLKTKKSFFSDVALEAQENMSARVRSLCSAALTSNLCPIFEYTSPDNKVVVDYGDDPNFTLLAIRDMVDGSYLSWDSLVLFAKYYGVDIVPRVSKFKTVKDLLDVTKTAEGIEGWVVYTDRGRYKVKTQWYMDRHRLIDIRERDIARFVLEETLDDMIPSLIEGEADLEVVRRIEREVATDLSRIMANIELYGSMAKDIPLGKERADWVSANAGVLSKFVHRAARDLENSDESIRDFYRQSHLSNFSLRSIGNPNFRGEENE